MKRLMLIIEKADHGFFGRTIYNENLIADEANTIIKLEDKIKKALKRYHGLKSEEIQFDHSYDLSVLFENFKYLKISNVAELAGINASLLRQYAIGNKNASSIQAKKVEDTIHKIGRELLDVKIYSKD